ncbi:MAG: BREX-1 system phosphatase PglZ type A [Butyrivibrio sp.]|nr:BREX-1 system phosphatase PglZ type A [Butyrivibrio sp.]
MDELNLTEIENKLNTEFMSGQRIVFWYDEDGSFESQVDELNLPDVTIHHLSDNNSFRTKLLVEHDRPEDKFLIYAPFAKPKVDRNHLEDTLRYSREFFADRLSLISADIGLPDRFHGVLKEIAPFFGLGSKISKEAIRRTNAFIEAAAGVDLAGADEEDIPLIAMCVVSGARNITVDDLIYSVLEYGSLEEEEIIKEFDKFNLKDAFWKMVEVRFSYYEPKPSLLRFAMSLFATAIFRDMEDDMPSKWEQYKLQKTSNACVLLDNMKNSVIYQESFDRISDEISKALDVQNALASVGVDKILNISDVDEADKLIVSWLIEREEGEDTSAKLSGKGIPEICDYRRRMHYGKKYENEYNALEAGYKLLFAAHYTAKDGIDEITQQYINEDYEYDRAYRRFITSIDKMKDADDFYTLKERMESIYQTEYLEKIMYAWNASIMENGLRKVIPLQRDFYGEKIGKMKNKVAVIISDAFRYEAAMDLVDLMNKNQNLTVSVDCMMATLPSFTPVGMASLLPHDEMTMKDDYTVLLDGSSCASKDQRGKILKSANSASLALSYSDDLRGHMSSNELRALTSGLEVIYIYHNAIDITGEGGPTEDKVFEGVQTAVSEVYDIIDKFSKRGNVYNFIITADHGFSYTRREVPPSGKLEKEAEKQGTFSDRRFLITSEDYSRDGVYAVRLGDSLGSSDNRFIMLPKGVSVFKTGGGMNYVHGGASPQEMIIPCISVHAQKGIVETKEVGLMLVSAVNKVTNLMVNLDFLQEEAVSDTVKPLNARIRFEAEDGEIISNEVLYKADSKAEDPRDRMFRLRFDIKRKAYRQDKKYFLHVIDDKRNSVLMEKQVIIDLPFTDNFGF